MRLLCEELGISLGDFKPGLSYNSGMNQLTILMEDTLALGHMVDGALDLLYNPTNKRAVGFRLAKPGRFLEEEFSRKTDHVPLRSLLERARATDSGVQGNDRERNYLEAINLSASFFVTPEIISQFRKD